MKRYSMIIKVIAFVSLALFITGCAEETQQQVNLPDGAEFQGLDLDSAPFATEKARAEELSVQFLGFVSCG